MVEAYFYFQDEIDDLAEEHNLELQQMAQLEKSLNELELHYNRIMKERKEAREEAERKELKHKLQSEAATFLQAAWKGYKTRKFLKNKKKKKGGKKKGKKGK